MASMSSHENKTDSDEIPSARDTAVVAALLISGTSSGVGKTTVTTGIMAAFAKRGYIVQPFKCGPDFLDGMHHEAAIHAGEMLSSSAATNSASKERSSCCSDSIYGDHDSINMQTKNSKRRCINLDGWMMGSNEAVRESFHRHARGADICILEGAMGLHDSRDGTTDEGSAAQIAKLLDIPVVLVIDGSMMARSVAAMALGYAMFDPDMRLGGVVANKVGGPNHIAWIAEALSKEGKGEVGRLKDVGTGDAVCFAGALPRDASASVPERHLGLAMPKEEDQLASGDASLRRYERLAALVEDHLDLDALLNLGKTACRRLTPTTGLLRSEPLFRLTEPMIATSSAPQSRCRIGIADDEAFCFYYMDNLHQLRMAGAELVPFSPLASPHLPPIGRKDDRSIPS